MIRFLLFFLFVSIGLNAQDIKVFEHFEDFETYLEKDDDKVHVVNFWATWCAPCIKELPYFEEINEKHGEEIDVTLVSLDFAKLLDTRVKSLVEKKDLKSNIVLLDDPKSNVWIDLVDKSWSGAIPATVVYRGDKREFYEKEFHSTEELMDIISTFK